eukprot:6186509-Pleurochrysis_carterae.AAC.2
MKRARQRRRAVGCSPAAPRLPCAGASRSKTVTTARFQCSTKHPRWRLCLRNRFRHNWSKLTFYS